MRSKRKGWNSNPAGRAGWPFLPALHLLARCSRIDSSARLGKTGHPARRDHTRVLKQSLSPSEKLFEQIGIEYGNLVPIHLAELDRRGEPLGRALPCVFQFLESENSSHRALGWNILSEFFPTVHDRMSDYESHGSWESCQNAVQSIQRILLDPSPVQQDETTTLPENKNPVNNRDESKPIQPL